MVDFKKLRSLNDVFTNVISQIFLMPMNTEGAADLTWTHRKILMTIDANGPQKMSAIARQIGVTMSGATAVVDKMVQAGLVVRELSPKDRRVVLVGLSDEGREILVKSVQAQEKHFEAILDRLPADKQTELLESFEKIRTLLLELQKAPASTGKTVSDKSKQTRKAAGSASGK